MNKDKKEVALYIATHNQTGLKYFGKTVSHLTQSSLQEKYHGSGTYWNRHIKKHGDNVTMELYGVYSLDNSSKDYVKPIALKFSKDNNIVNSVEWANLCEENGLGGGDSNFTGVYHKETGMYIKMTREKYQQNKQNYNTGMSNKMTAFVKDIGKYKAITTEEFRKNRHLYLAPNETYDEVDITCPHCGFKGGNSIKRFHFEKCHIINENVPLIDIVHFKTNHILYKNISLTDLNKISLVFKNKSKDNYFGKSKLSLAVLKKAKKEYLIGYFPIDKRNIL